MNYGFESIEIRFCYVTKIFANLGNLLRGLTKFTALKEIRVEANNIMPGSANHRARDRTNIAFVTSDEYPHTSPIRSRFLAGLESQSRIRMAPRLLPAGIGGAL